jgi:hypothetical protein
MTDRSVRNAYSRLANQEHIKDSIDALKAQTKTAVESHQKLSNDWIVERLQEEALKDDNPAATRVRALELLGKTGGLFDDSTHVTVEHRSPETIEKELMDKLGLLFGDSSVTN